MTCRQKAQVHIKREMITDRLYTYALFECLLAVFAVKRQNIVNLAAALFPPKIELLIRVKNESPFFRNRKDRSAPSIAEKNKYNCISLLDACWSA